MQNYKRMCAQVLPLTLHCCSGHLLFGSGLDISARGLFLKSTFCRTTPMTCARRLAAVRKGVQHR